MNIGALGFSDNLSQEIYRRIEVGRCSPTRYGSVDMFVGPFLGRNTSHVRLEGLIEDIGAPQRFQSSQPIIAVKSKSGPTRGKLIVIGGGHRLLSAARSLHAVVLPYKLVSFTGLGSEGEDLDVFECSGIITFHVEVNEPRPEKYGFMQQVNLYADLKAHWRCLEKIRVSKLRGRKGKPQAISYNKLYRFYEASSKLAGTKSRWAIEFLARKDNKNIENKPATRRQYMAGTDRLLHAGVVPYLAHLENIGVASFNRSSLYAVRNWSSDKIRHVVELWKVRRRTGVKVRYAFSEKAGREVDGKGRGRKSKQKLEDVVDSVLTGKRGRKGEEISKPKPQNEPHVTSESRGVTGEPHTGDLIPGRCEPSPVRREREFMTNVSHTRHAAAFTRAESHSAGGLVGFSFPDQAHYQRGASYLDDVGTEEDVNNVMKGGDSVRFSKGTNLTYESSKDEIEEKDSGCRRGFTKPSVLGKIPDQDAVCKDPGSTGFTQPKLSDKESLSAGHFVADANASHSSRKRYDIDVRISSSVPQRIAEHALKEDSLCAVPEVEESCPVQSARATEGKMDRTVLASVDEACALLCSLARKKAPEKNGVLDVDLENEIKVAAHVKERLIAEGGKSDLPLPAVMSDMAAKLGDAEKKEVKLVVTGGILENTFTLCESDITPIRQFHIGTDRSVMFTVSFLTKWTSDSVNACHLLDSLQTAGWWDVKLSQEKDRLRSLIEKVNGEGPFSSRCHEAVWGSSVCVMPMCGAGHWSLIVLLNLKGWQDIVGRRKRSRVRNSDGLPRILFLDSMGPSSAHKETCTNIFYYLSACYPGKRRPSPRSLEKNIPSCHFYLQLQKEMECGFFVGYHISLFTRAFHRIGGLTSLQIEELLREMSELYTFEEYQTDVLRRLEYYVMKYKDNSRRVICEPVWMWGSEPAADTMGASENIICREDSLGSPLKRKASGDPEGPACKRGLMGQKGNFRKPVREKRGTAVELGNVLEKQGQLKLVGSRSQTDLEKVELGKKEEGSCVREGVVLHPMGGWVSGFVLDLVNGAMKGDSRATEGVLGTPQCPGSIEVDRGAGEKDVFLGMVQEAMVLARRVKSNAIRRQSEECKQQICELLLKMKTEG